MTTESLASLLKTIEEGRSHNKTYLDQYKSNIKGFADKLRSLEKDLNETQFKFYNLINIKEIDMTCSQLNLRLSA